MPADPRMLEMSSYYRDAELHGASLLLRLLKMTRDLPDVQVYAELAVHERQAFAAPRAASVASSAADPERRPA